jgi:lipopolysaccharide export system ATP-binding protein
VPTPPQIPVSATARLVPPVPAPHTVPPTVILDPYLPANADRGPRPDDDPPPAGPNGPRPLSKTAPIPPMPVLVAAKPPVVPIRDEAPPQPALGPPVMPPMRPVANTAPLFGSSGPGAFSVPTLQLLVLEKMRRMADLLAADDWQTGWHELAARGHDAIPILLEALERREPNARHLAFRLLEQVTGQALEFQADAPDDIRLRQIAHLRARLEPRRAA